VKKCASCTKDLPEAALHCVFCGAKQPPAPAVQPGLAKTAFGYSNEMMEQLKQSGGQAPAPYQAPPRQNPPSQPPPSYGQPQPYQGGLSPSAPANAATMFVQGGPPPMQPPQQQPAFQATQMAPPPPQMGGGMQPMGGMPPPNYGQPPPQMGGMGVHSPHQLTPQPLPQVAQPYGAQHAQRGGQPVEPWKDSLPLMMIIWGVAMLVAFATPLSISPLHFNWDLIIHGEGAKAKIPFLVVASVGLLGVVFGAIPLMSLPRGILAAILGLAGLAVPIALADKLPEWQELLQIGGVLVLVPGLLVRNEYVESMLARILVTVGVVCVLVPYLIPSGGEIPLVNIFKGLLDAPGQAKVQFILEIAKIALVVVSLLAWMPGPATGGAKVFAWAIILFPVVQFVVALLLSSHFVDQIKDAPGTLVVWVPAVVYSVFTGYGLATVFGKQLE